MFENVLKKLKKLSGKVLNSTNTYLVLIVIILIQFIFVSIIFFTQRKNANLAESLAKVEAQQNQILINLTGLQANLMRLQAQMYRLQPSQ